MKQHITVEQLEELTDGQVCDLNTLMKHEWALTNRELQKYSWKRVLEDTAKYCTIGRMIEIITNFIHDIGMFMGDGYWDAVVKINKNREYKSEWLCDALWECLKDVALDISESEG